MNNLRNELDAVITDALSGPAESSTLGNDIMEKISGGTRKRKALNAKVNIVVLSYIGLTVISLLVMLTLTPGFQVNKSLLKIPSFDTESLKGYYTLMITCSVLSFISFIIYYLKSGQPANIE